MRTIANADVIMCVFNRVCVRPALMLGKTISGRITTQCSPMPEAPDRGPCAGHVVIAYGLPDQPWVRTPPSHVITTGVAGLDIVAYDRHINDDCHEDTAGH